MHTALVGASRGIGRATALDLLDDGSSSVSLLLRSPRNIQADPDFQSAIAQGRVRIVQGDAYNADDVRELLDHDGIDSVVFTLGAVYPNGKRQFSFTKGFLLPSLDVCTSATLVLATVLDDLAKVGRRTPALVAVSVTGVGKSADYLPYAYKWILPWLLQQTIDDKRGVETILSHISSSLSPESDPPSKNVLDEEKLDTLTKGFLDQVLVVRPAQLKDTDGTNLLRAGEEVSTYSTGRVELGRWIASALRNRGTWMNRRLTVGL